MAIGRIIENAELVEIRKEDGAQKYKFGSGPLDTIWLSGWNRASDVKVGDKGQLEWKSAEGYGLYFFNKY